ncbi:hypothetical protein [Zavarzinella formosa]|uniref:hypothetical protein n=1 Tax=Zavarzinella formosa TaxID=360055 RepID=UPI00049607BF|nr:hypothetical protein [Zavarzinella formosa]
MDNAQPELPPARRDPVKSIITFAIVLTLVFGAVFLIRTVSLQSEQFDRELLQHVDHVNHVAPVKISEECNLIGSTAGPGRVLTNIYKYVDLIKTPDFDSVEFAEKNRLALVERYRTDPSLKKFRDNGLTIRAQYLDSKGELLAEIEVKATD